MDESMSRMITALESAVFGIIGPPPVVLRCGNQTRVSAKTYRILKAEAELNGRRIGKIRNDEDYLKCLIRACPTKDLEELRSTLDQASGEVGW